MNILKSEFFKMLHKKETYLFAVLILGCSVFFSILIGTNNTSMQIQGLDMMGGGLFTVFFYTFLFELFLFPIIISTIVIRIWASDFSNGTIAYDITITNNRTIVFLGKVVVSLVACLIYTLILIGLGFLSYKIFAVSGKYYTSDLLYLVNDTYWKFLITSLLVVIFICSLSTLFSMSENSTLSMVLTIGLLMVSRLLEKVKNIKEYMPTYLLNCSNTLTSSNQDFWIGVIVIIAISGGLYVLSYKIFKKNNIN